MIDVRAYRGADIASDHQLVIAKLKIKIARATKQEQSVNRRYNIRRLKDPNTSQQFSIKLKNRFQALAEMDDGTIDQKWERVKSTFTITCKEELGFAKREHKVWLSEETIQAIERRRMTKIQLEQAKTRAQKARLTREHTEYNKEVKRKARKDRRDYVNQLASQAEDAMFRNDTKTV